MIFQHPLWAHIFFGLLLSLAVACAVSAYREDLSKAIWRGMWIRFFKIIIFCAVLALAMVVFEKFFIDRHV